VLSPRALNRALLARQLLLERSLLDALDAIEHLVGIQAQNPNDPYLALWARLHDFRPEALARMMTGRHVVRIALMRSTIHLVSARDCRMLRPLLQPVLERSVKGQFGKHLVGVDLGELAAAGRELVEGKARTVGEIGKVLGQRWPGRDTAALGNAVRALVPLVQVPPRGVWGSGGLAVHTTAESWLGSPLDAAPSIDPIVLRYLGAFGPATVNDIQQRCGLTRLRGAIERLRPGLVTFRDERGRELFDVPEGPRPGPDTPAPVRFLPEYDNVMLSHVDRSRVICDEDGRVLWRLLTQAGGIHFATITVDGFLGGAWRVARTGDAAVLAVWLFRRPAKKEVAAIEQEGAELLTLVAPDAGTRKIEFSDP